MNKTISIALLAALASVTGIGLNAFAANFESVRPEELPNFGTPDQPRVNVERLFGVDQRRGPSGGYAIPAAPNSAQAECAERQLSLFKKVASDYPSPELFRRMKVAAVSVMVTDYSGPLAASQGLGRQNSAQRVERAGVHYAPMWTEDRPARFISQADYTINASINSNGRCDVATEEEIKASFDSWASREGRAGWQINPQEQQARAVDHQQTEDLNERSLRAARAGANFADVLRPPTSVGAVSPAAISGATTPAAGTGPAVPPSAPAGFGCGTNPCGGGGGSQFR